ncbi:hypothetical protein CLOM_g14652 [Closterium sp. NIES-68]|nr:hypothetical protein CLOM_g14652 [Closterium sp. NIES-68]GJP78183.1 hypothetical protein CLOP_g8514 [Closterium sp. NIES-67]
MAFAVSWKDSHKGFMSDHFRPETARGSSQHLRTTASFSTTRYVLLILVSYLAFVTSKILTLIASGILRDDVFLYERD